MRVYPTHYYIRCNDRIVLEWRWFLVIQILKHWKLICIDHNVYLLQHIVITAYAIQRNPGRKNVFHWN